MGIRQHDQTELILPDTLGPDAIKTLQPIKRLKKLTVGDDEKIFQRGAFKGVVTKKMKVTVNGLDDLKKKKAKKAVKKYKKYLVKTGKAKKNIKVKKG